MSGIGIDNTSKKAVTEDYVRFLEMRLQELQAELQWVKKEREYYRNQVEKMMTPPLVEATVLEVLDDDRAIVKSTTGPNLVVRILGSVDREALRPGVRVALNQRGSAIVEVLPTREDPYVRAMEVIERPNVRWEDVGGLEDVKQLVREVVELPLKYPEMFKEVGIEPPKGVLLYGPPGTGKTLIAKAVAGETNATFIKLVASELAQKFVGEGARIVREVFALARKKAPSIILIDEIDAIAGKRMEVGTSGEREINRTLTQLLAELDGFDPLDRVKVIATTNRLDVIDPALLRPGRFDRIIEVPPPDYRGRLEIFRIHTRRMNLSKDVDLAYLAKITEGATGADIKAICTEAGYNAIRARRKVVKMEDFLKAIESVLKGRFRPYVQTGPSGSEEKHVI